MGQKTMVTRQTLIQIETRDRLLLSHIADAMEEAARRSGEWLVCRPGCTQCCLGPFAITQLDARRLRAGLADLDNSDPARAKRVRARAAAYVESIAPQYAGGDVDQLPAWLDDAPCPALDPETGWCDLYAARPITCRTFGPVTRTADDTLAACELCYAGATDEQMAACEVEIDPQGLEAEILTELDGLGESGLTMVAFALQPGPRKAI